MPDVSDTTTPPVVEDPRTGERAVCTFVGRFGWLCGLCNRGWPFRSLQDKCGYCGAVLVKEISAGAE